MTNNRPIFFLLAVALLLRLGLFLASKPWDPGMRDNVLIFEDARDYNRLALNMLEHHTFSLSTDYTRLDALRTPLYPAYVAAFYGTTGWNPWLVVLSQVFLDCFTCYLLFCLLRRFVSFRAALIAAFVYALDPFLILYSNNLLSDTLLVFLIVSGFTLLVRALLAEHDRSRMWLFTAAGLVFGLATLNKPIGQYLMLIEAVFVLVFFRKTHAGAAYVAALAAAYLVVLAPWVLRNKVDFGQAALSTSVKYNLLVNGVRPMEMEVRRQDSFTVQDSLLAEADSRMVADGKNPALLNPFQKAAYWQSLAIEYIRNDPARFAKHYFLGIAQIFLNLDTRRYGDLLRIGKQRAGQPETFDMKAYPNMFEGIKAWIAYKNPGQIALGVGIFLWLVLTYILTIAGLTSWRTLEPRWFFVLCLIFVLYFVLTTGSNGTARYKMPIVPFYAPFAGIGAEKFLARRRRKNEATIG